ncbi:unnamed protein product [Sphacelaria rigidula]
MRKFAEPATQSRVCATATPTSTASAVTSTLLTVASTAAFVASTAVLLTGLAQHSGMLYYFTQDSTAATAATTKPAGESIGSALPPSYSASSLSSSSFSIGGSAWGTSSGGGSRGHRQPSCEASDDPDYTCLLSRPPGAFDNEFSIYLSSSLSGGHQGERRGGTPLLNVKLVVSGVANAVANGGEMVERSGVWASLGFSPNGRMAGPSEAVIGVLGGGESGQGPGALRYRMDGYNSSSVMPLGNREQILTEATVETSADGSLIVRFSRPFSDPLSPPPLLPRKLDCRPPPNEGEDEKMEGAGGGGGEASVERLDLNRGAHAELCPAPDSGLMEEEESKNEIALAWMDPRDEGVVVLWAYGSRAPWPSYHEATGSFVLPVLPGV